MTAQLFRELFGSFPTPVAIITALGGDGVPRGFTCNAVCAVSAAPPQLLICADHRSQTLPAILTSGAFVVNVLAPDGADASRLFAGKRDDKFAGVAWEPSVIAGGAPVLTEVALSYMECRVTRVVEAADHAVIFASVDGGAVLRREALLYCRGDYTSWTPSVPVGAHEPG
ncbi:flavin reductase family protein [Actinoplanes sp. NPDC049802]|uniref:flavin reductase family protein n=1 Tax=Actinoplanes sp. NPDC049802 TaxID=3154742 RepID=UPI0033F8C012